MSEDIRVLVVDDHPLVRYGIISFLETKTGITSIGEAENGHEAVKKVLDLKPDITLLDLAMPQKDGLSALRDIIRQEAEAKILIVTNYGEEQMVLDAFLEGASGCVLKNSHTDDLVKAIRTVHGGGVHIDPQITGRVIAYMRAPEKMNALSQLTDREREVYRWMAQGLTNQQIALKLGIKERTVGVHVGNILKKLEVDNRTQAALMAFKNRWFDHK